MHTIQKKTKTTAKTGNKERKKATKKKRKDESKNNVNGCKVEKNKIIYTIQSQKSHLRVTINNYEVTAKVFNQN